MTRHKQLRNRKGRNGGCRSHLHAYTLAKIQSRHEFFMNARDMRRYWDETRSKLYGPLRLMTRWLDTKI